MGQMFKDTETEQQYAYPEATIIGNAAMLMRSFEQTEGGWIAYKIFNSQYVAPSHWIIAPDSVIVHPYIRRDVESSCGPGINVANSVQWIKDYVAGTCGKYDQLGNRLGSVWKVFIPETATIVIPNGSRGKIRVTEIKLLEIVDQVDYHSAIVE